MTNNSNDESGQGWENFGQDVVVDCPQNLPGVLVGNAGGLIESYVQNRIEIHVHLSIGIDGVSAVNREYCVVYNRYLEDLKLPVEPDVGDHVSPDLHSSKFVDHGMEKAVLVDVRQLAELPEGVCVKAVPSVVRLQTLNDCLHRWIDSADLARRRLLEKARASTGISAPVFIPEDRELGIALEILWSTGQGAVRVGQGEGQMVERRADVVEDVADYHGELGGREVVDFDADLVIARGISTALMNDRVMISIEPLQNLLFELRQVVVRPI